VEIELDDIVVLVGPNNAGKSTILRAYEAITSSSAPVLSIEEFHDRKVDIYNPPTVELHTAVFDDLPANRWIADVAGEKIVRERWVWSGPGEKAKRQGWDTTSADAIKWSEQVPWGAANVANSRRPLPHRIEAFADPALQIKKVTEMLLESLQEKFEERPRYEINDDGSKALDENGKPKLTPYGELIQALADNQNAAVAETKADIEKVESSLTEFVKGIFPNYSVKFDAKPDDDLTKALNFFKAGTTLRMGPAGGHLSDASRQGSGARRTLMWAALRYIAENSEKSKNTQTHLLLLDEPELCLHPTAVREACETLYALPATGKWQVMVTTHCPDFIDLSRDNTTIVRVERMAAGAVSGTTVFRPSRIKLGDDDKQHLKLLNYYDPYVAEFFFGGRTIIVEGDTEYTAFRWAINTNKSEYGDVHVIRARGKATIALLAKILNQFGAGYAILHDSDTPTVIRKKDNKEIANGAWTNNTLILDVVKSAPKPDRVRLVAALTGFEAAMFGELVDDEKPYNAYTTLRGEESARTAVLTLFRALIDFQQPLPPSCHQWNDINLLKAAYSASAQPAPAATVAISGGN